MCSLCISLFPIVKDLPHCKNSPVSLACCCISSSLKYLVGVVQSLSHVWLFATPISRLQHASLPCPSPSPRGCSNSCPLSQWCHLNISSSVSTEQVQNKYFWNKLMCPSKSTIDRFNKVTDVSKGGRGFAYFPLMTKFSVSWNVIELRSWKELKVQRKWDS